MKTQECGLLPQAELQLFLTDNPLGLYIGYTRRIDSSASNALG